MSEQRCKVCGEIPCRLQRLGDHTVTVTKSRDPTANVLIFVIDADDSDHFVVGGNVQPPIALRLLDKARFHLQRMLARN